MSGTTPASISTPKSVAIDSAHLGDIVRDKNSLAASARSKAEAFEAGLERADAVLTLSRHHIDELIAHKDDEVVAARIQYIKSLPLVAWVRSVDGFTTLGNVVDITAMELAAATTLETIEIVAVKRAARPNIFNFGTGEQALADYLPDIWKMRDVALKGAERHRNHIAITRSKVDDPKAKTLGDLLEGELKSPGEAEAWLRQYRERLLQEIKDRGDDRIGDAERLATEYTLRLAREGAEMARMPDHPGLGMLIRSGVRPEELKPNVKLERLLDIVEFRGKMRAAADTAGIDRRLIDDGTIRPKHIPSCEIARCVEKYYIDQKRRSGSELNDKHLACLAPYVGILFVDRRMHETFKTAQSRSSEFARVVGRVEKVPSYSEILKCL